MCGVSANVHLGENPNAEEADAERLADAQHLAQVLVRLSRRLVQRFDGAPGELELAARLEADVAAQRALRPLQRDDLVALEDRLPAEARDQRLHQRARCCARPRRGRASACRYERRTSRARCRSATARLGFSPAAIHATRSSRDRTRSARRAIFTCRHSAGLGFGAAKSLQIQGLAARRQRKRAPECNRHPLSVSKREPLRPRRGVCNPMPPLQRGTCSYHKKTLLHATNCRAGSFCRLDGIGRSPPLVVG